MPHTHTHTHTPTSFVWTKPTCLVTNLTLKGADTNQLGVHANLFGTKSSSVKGADTNLLGGRFPNLIWRKPNLLGSDTRNVEDATVQKMDDVKPPTETPMKTRVSVA